MLIGLAREVAREGIRVNAVRAGPTATEMMLGRDPERLAAIRRSVPMGRLGTPEEIAAAVLWRLEPAGSFVTGALLDATGGL